MVYTIRVEENPIVKIFTFLAEEYGFQGWWPLFSRRNTGLRDGKGYLKTSSNEILNSRSRFEIAAGAVLTQNTAWTNVEKALENLDSAGLLDAEAIINAELPVLAEAVRPSGYYNQKARKLKILASFLLEGGYLESGKYPSRQDLLDLWGVGKETADSILLYAYNLPFFVVDAYTVRIFKRLNVVDGNESYDIIASRITASLNSDPGLFGEYHALIVKHAKEHCRKKPVCGNCVLRKLCSFAGIKDEQE